MSDSLEETLRKVIEDIDLSGDDEMVFAEKAEGLISGEQEGKPNALEAACATAKEASNRIAESRDAVDAPGIDPR